jgi:hypothetical protein
VIYSTFFGAGTNINSLFVDSNGVLCVAGDHLGGYPPCINWFGSPDLVDRWFVAKIADSPADEERKLHIIQTPERRRGTVVYQPPGYTCDSLFCWREYAKGKKVVLTAKPNGNFFFGGWSGACTGKGLCKLSMEEDRSVTAIFYHRKPTVVLPNGTETIPAGSTFTVTWGGPPKAVRFSLFYSLDDGVTWKRIPGAVKVAGDKFDWLVTPPPGNRRKCRVKVAGFDASNVYLGSDVSDWTFVVEVVRLTSPNSGSYRPGHTCTLEWVTYGTIRSVETVEFLYSLDGGATWKQMKGSPVSGNPGRFDWIVPKVTEDKSCCIKVVLKDANGKSIGSATNWLEIITY